MHVLLQGIEFDEISRARLGFFINIEELQLTYAACITKLIAPDMFLDIGANIGAYSLVLSKINPEMQVCAIEASRETFDILQGNFQKNLADHQRVKAVNVAATSEHTVLEFADFGGASGKNGVASSSIHETKDAQIVSVQGLPIDEIVEETGKTVLVKVDTEGHELDALKGASKLMRRNRCLIQAEVGHGDSGGGAVRELLQELGYRELFMIGPDAYFMSLGFGYDDKDIRALHERSILTFGSQRWGKRCSWLDGD